MFFATKLRRHSREDGSPVRRLDWIPAFAGMMACLTFNFSAHAQLSVESVASAMSESANIQESPSGSATITTPPSEEKQRLIAEFLRLTGVEQSIDRASFIDRFAMQDHMAVWRGSDERRFTFREALDHVFDAYRTEFAKYRDQFQQAYASHVNWEFTEEELRTINGFLRSDTGQHYLDGLWRMNAYTTTNTEDIIAEVTQNVRSSLIDQGFPVEQESDPYTVVLEQDSSDDDDE